MSKSQIFPLLFNNTHNTFNQFTNMLPNKFHTSNNLKSKYHMFNNNLKCKSLFLNQLFNNNCMSMFLQSKHTHLWSKLSQKLKLTMSTVNQLKLSLKFLFNISSNNQFLNNNNNNLMFLKLLKKKKYVPLNNHLFQSSTNSMNPLNNTFQLNHPHTSKNTTPSVKSPNNMSKFHLPSLNNTLDNQLFNNL